MKKSIIQHERQCLICGSWNIELYPIFKTSSEEYGFKVWLCPTHQEKRSKDSKLDLELKQLGQKSFEYHYGTREDFIKNFGKSYL